MSALKTILHLGWPWHRSRKEDDSYPLRYMARKGRLKKVPFLLRPAVFLLSTILWPIGAALQCLQISKFKARHVNEFPTGYSGVTAYRAAIRLNIPPWDYLTYKLWEVGNIDQGHILQHERAGLMHILNSPSYEPAKNPIENKLALSEFCHRHQIPHPRLIWHNRHTEVPVVDPNLALWAKPVEGAHGTHQGPTLDFETIKSAPVHMLIQERMENHPSLSPFSNGALIVARIVSGKFKSSDIEIFAATLHMPYGNAETSHTGIIARLDLKDGKVLNVREASTLYSSTEFHPDTGEPFSDLSIPDWNDAVAIIEKAHAALNGYVFIGWDLAFTPSGPILIEGNSSWNAEQHQEAAPDPNPLGKTVLLDILKSHFTN